MISTVCRKDVIPTRAVIGVMIFTACLFAYMLRVNISINIIAMVESTESVSINTGNDSIQEKLQSSPNYGPRYEWDSKVQGLVLGSYFWGYILTSIPGGYLAEMCGPKRTILVASLTSAAMTILTPIAADWHYSIVITLRFILGLLGGVIYPALHCLISRWAPPVEKGKFTGALLGGNLGTVLTWPIMGAIIESWGWSWAFYVPGFLTLLWSLLWFFLVTDTPDSHPRISDEEKIHIAKCIGNDVGSSRVLPPYLSMAVSIPFWALATLHFGNLWGLYFLLTAGPKYMSEVLGFDLGHSGILAALPNLARMLFGFVFGAIGDLIRTKGWMEITFTRKFFVIFSHIIPGLFLIGQTLIGTDSTLAVILLTLALGFNGASTVTNLQNSQDLSPTFAGTIYGIINSIGGTTGFINPMIIGLLITSNNSTIDEWYVIFYIGAAVYIGCGIVFFIFGTGLTQPWNYVKQDNSNLAQLENSNNATTGICNKSFEGDTNLKDENTKV